MSRVLSEQEQVRRTTLNRLKELGINPYPADLFPVNALSKQIKTNYEEGKEVIIAGRFMSKRIMGKASFAEVQDAEGTIQIYVSRDDICEGEDKTMYNDVFKKYLDRGDIVGITGRVFKTQVGEISVHATEIKLLTKSLRPLPIVKIDSEGKTHDAFTNPEQRYRQRYTDLIVNPHVKEAFIKRTKLITFFSLRLF